MQNDQGRHLISAQQAQTMLTNSKKPWRVSSNHWAGIAMLAALAAASAYVGQTGFAQELIAQASPHLQAQSAGLIFR
jgi:hypothetical protein